MTKNCCDRSDAVAASSSERARARSAPRRPAVNSSIEDDTPAEYASAPGPEAPVAPPVVPVALNTFERRAALLTARLGRYAPLLTRTPERATRSASSDCVIVGLTARARSSTVARSSVESIRTDDAVSADDGEAAACAAERDANVQSTAAATIAAPPMRADVVR